MRSLPILGLGIFFALAGLGMFAITLRNATAEAQKTPGAPLKKSEQRELQAQRAAQQTESSKLRIAAAVSVAIGAALIVFS